MKRIKKCSLLLLCIMCMSCAQKLPICKKNEAIQFNNANSELVFSLAYLPRNILISTPNPNIEKIDYNQQFESYIYAKLAKLGIDKKSVSIKDSSFENFDITVKNASPYQVCDLSNLQIDLQQRLNTKHQSFFTINKDGENIINSDTLIVPYNPMTLKFVYLNPEHHSIGAGAVLVNYLYFNEDNDKIYQKIKGIIDVVDIDVDIPYEESSIVKVDNKMTIFIRNVNYKTTNR